jgi:hypothetical protein
MKGVATPSFCLNIAPWGRASPPSSPSQSAYIIGHCSLYVVGSEYRCTSPEVGRLLFAKLVTGEEKARPSALVLVPLSLSTRIFINVLFPAPRSFVRTQNSRVSQRYGKNDIPVCPMKDTSYG